MPESVRLREGLISDWGFVFQVVGSVVQVLCAIKGVSFRNPRQHWSQT